MQLLLPLMFLLMCAIPNAMAVDRLIDPLVISNTDYTGGLSVGRSTVFINCTFHSDVKVLMAAGTLQSEFAYFSFLGCMFSSSFGGLLINGAGAAVLEVTVQHSTCIGPIKMSGLSGGHATVTIAESTLGTATSNSAAVVVTGGLSRCSVLRIRDNAIAVGSAPQPFAVVSLEGNAGSGFSIQSTSAIVVFGNTVVVSGSYSSRGVVACTAMALSLDQGGALVVVGNNISNATVVATAGAMTVSDTSSVVIKGNRVMMSRAMDVAVVAAAGSVTARGIVVIANNSITDTSPSSHTAALLVLGTSISTFSDGVVDISGNVMRCGHNKVALVEGKGITGGTIAVSRNSLLATNTAGSCFGVSVDAITVATLSITHTSMECRGLTVSLLRVAEFSIPKRAVCFIANNTLLLITTSASGTSAASAATGLVAVSLATMLSSPADLFIVGNNVTVLRPLVIPAANDAFVALSYVSGTQVAINGGNTYKDVNTVSAPLRPFLKASGTTSYVTVCLERQVYYDVTLTSATLAASVAYSLTTSSCTIASPLWWSPLPAMTVLRRLFTVQATNYWIEIFNTAARKSCGTATYSLEGSPSISHSPRSDTRSPRTGTVAATDTQHGPLPAGPRTGTWTVLTASPTSNLLSASSSHNGTHSAVGDVTATKAPLATGTATRTVVPSTSLTLYTVRPTASLRLTRPTPAATPTPRLTPSDAAPTRTPSAALTHSLSFDWCRALNSVANTNGSTACANIVPVALPSGATHQCSDGALSIIVPSSAWGGEKAVTVALRFPLAATRKMSGAWNITVVDPSTSSSGAVVGVPVVNVSISTLTLTLVVPASLRSSSQEARTDVLRLPRAFFSVCDTPKPLQFSITWQRAAALPISPQAVQAVESVAAATGVASVASGSVTMIVSQGLLAGLSRLVECEELDPTATLPTLSNLLGFGVGDEVGRYYRGALFGNLIVGGLVVVAMVGVVYAVLAARRALKMPEANNTFAYCAGLIGCPSLAIIGVAIVCQSTTAAATVLFQVATGPGDYILAAVCLLLLTAYAAFVWRAVTCTFRGLLLWDQRPPDMSHGRARRFFVWCFNPRAEWIAASSHLHHEASLSPNDGDDDDEDTLAAEREEKLLRTPPLTVKPTITTSGDESNDSNDGDFWESDEKDAAVDDSGKDASQLDAIVSVQESRRKKKNKSGTQNKKKGDNETPLTLDELWVAQQIHFVADYRFAVFNVVELSASFLFGILEGIITSNLTVCRARDAVTLAIFFGLFAFPAIGYIALVRVNQLLINIINALAFLAALFIVLGNYDEDNDEQYAAVVSVCTFAGMIAGIVKFAIDMVTTLLDTRETIGTLLFQLRRLQRHIVSIVKGPSGLTPPTSVSRRPVARSDLADAPPLPGRNLTSVLSAASSSASSDDDDGPDFFSETQRGYNGDQPVELTALRPGSGSDEERDVVNVSDTERIAWLRRCARVVVHHRPDHVPVLARLAAAPQYQNGHEADLLHRLTTLYGPEPSQDIDIDTHAAMAAIATAAADASFDRQKGGVPARHSPSSRSRSAANEAAVEAFPHLAYADCAWADAVKLCTRSGALGAGACLCAQHLYVGDGFGIVRCVPLASIRAVEALPSSGRGMAAAGIGGGMAVVLRITVDHRDDTSAAIPTSNACARTNDDVALAFATQQSAGDFIGALSALVASSSGGARTLPPVGVATTATGSSSSSSAMLLLLPEVVVQDPSQTEPLPLRPDCPEALHMERAYLLLAARNDTERAAIDGPLLEMFHSGAGKQTARDRRDDDTDDFSQDDPLWQTI